MFRQPTPVFDPCARLALRRGRGDRGADLRRLQRLRDLVVAGETPAHANQVVAHVTQILIAIRRIFFQRPVDDRDDFGIEIGNRVRERGGCLVHNPSEYSVLQRPRKRRFVTNQLVGDVTNREDIAAMIDRLPGDLFGRHVRERTNEDARLGHTRRGGSDDAEVQYLHGTVTVKHQVCRFDVAMDQSCFVRVAQAIT